MLQSLAARGKKSVQFGAGVGAHLGRFRLVELLTGPRPRLSQLEWPDEFEEGFNSKYGEGTFLGKGGQGEVWKAEDPATGEVVAVKIYIDNTKKPSGYLNWNNANEDQRDALLAAKNECDLMMMLKTHEAEDPAGYSHVLQCFEEHIIPKDDSDSELPAYVVLEFGGSDLTKWLHKRNNTLGDPEEGRQWIAQILQVLRFLQAQDPPILHRDLKPENVMLAEGPNGTKTLKVFDFGCAQNGTEEARHDEFHLKCYTMAWAAPEVAWKNCMHDPDHPVAFEMPASTFDIYSVGMMYWNMLCPNISVKNHVAAPYLLKFWCANEPLGTGGFTDPGFIRELLDMKDEAGDPLCPAISDDEVDLVESMIGTWEKRPTPSEVLASPFLSKYDK